MLDAEELLSADLGPSFPALVAFAVGEDVWLDNPTIDAADAEELGIAVSSEVALPTLESSTTDVEDV